MVEFAAALLPALLIVALGWVIAHSGFIAREAWAPIERLVYYVLFPALIAHTLAKAEFSRASLLVIATVLGAQFVMAGLGLLARHRGGSSEFGRPAKGSIVQSNVRWNTFVAVAVVDTLYGTQGLALLAIVAASMIPSANIISIVALIHYSTRPDERISAGDIALRVLTNPLVIACVVGGLLGLFHLPEDTLADRVLVSLGQASVALGLLTAGAGIDLTFLKRSGTRTVYWSLMRLIVMPLAALGIGLALKLPPMALVIVVIAASTSTATSGYILARQLGGNASLSANLIAMQSLLSIITMPAMYLLAVALAR
jgi:predicted permease